jgi:hypothetical protein
MAREEQPDFYPYLDLKRARLCLDCEMLFEGPRCPACASESYVPVTRWIRPTDRRAVEQPTPPAPPPAKSRGLLRKSIYVGIGAFGLWKMLFTPARPRPRKPPLN